MRLSPTRSWWCVLPFLLAHSGKFLLLHSKLSVGNSNTLFMLRIDFSWNVLVGSLMLLSGFSFRTSSRLLSWVSLVLSKTLSMLRSELPPGTSWHPLGPNTLLNTAARSCRYALDANTPFMLRSELSLGTSTLSWCYALTPSWNSPTHALDATLHHGLDATVSTSSWTFQRVLDARLLLIPTYSWSQAPKFLLKNSNTLLFLLS